jgi:hypothetical protein
MEWYFEQENPYQKYREYRWLLHVFQSLDPEQRLTLKAPAHIGNLEALLQAVPDAMVIHLHRDLVICIKSVCSLLYTFHLAVSDEIDIQSMASLILHGYEAWGRRNLAFSETHPGVIYDVYFDSLVSDPIGTVRGIYEHFDLPWSEINVAVLETYINQNPKGKHGKHHYSAADYGLTEDEIEDKLGFYNDFFGL